jgi:hypothetical protein
MKTLEIVYTKGDYATLPGGIILRYNEDKDEYVTHRFHRIPHTRGPHGFFWGHYFSGPDAEARARADFASRVSNCIDPIVDEGTIVAKGDAGFDAGGNWELI